MSVYLHPDWKNHKPETDGNVILEVQCLQHSAGNSPTSRFRRDIKLISPVPIDTSLSLAYLMARRARVLENKIDNLGFNESGVEEMIARIQEQATQIENLRLDVGKLVADLKISDGLVGVLQKEIKAANDLVEKLALENAEPETG